MAEDKSSIELRSREDVEAFLSRHPREWAEMLAARAALRILPLLREAVAPIWVSPDFHPDIALTFFRAFSLPWLGGHGYAQGNDRASAVSATNAAVAELSSTVSLIGRSQDAVRAAKAVGAVVAAKDHWSAVRAARNTVAAAAGYDKSAARFQETYTAVSIDAWQMLKLGGAGLTTPLWPADAKIGLGDTSWRSLLETDWFAFKASLAMRSDAAAWREVWIDWYESVRDGMAPWHMPHDAGRQLLKQSQSWLQSDWESRPDSINRRLLQAINAHQRESHLGQLLTEGDGQQQSSVIDVPLKIEIRNTDDVTAFLRRRPLEWNQLLSARIALRCFPIFGSINNSNHKNSKSLDRILILFRGVALAWLAAISRRSKHLIQTISSADDQLGIYDFGKAFDSADRAISLAKSVVHTAAIAHAAGDAVTDAAHAAAYAIGSNVTDEKYLLVWDALSADATILTHGGGAALRERPLWPDRPPRFARELWHKLSEMLKQATNGEDWSLVWIDWYEAIRDGAAPWGLPREVGEQVLVEAMLWPQEEWDKGALHINRRIAGLIEAARRNQTSELPVPEPIPSRRDPLPPVPPQLPDSEPASRDFFVSYCHVDEAIAREVVDVVEGLGFSAFAQFRDMGPGSNFVREMQRGLATSSRVIALYSPDYEASHQCQAEWSAAYNADPGGEKRKLLPLLLKPTRLNPLAQQIVYKSLVGLSVAERRAAIIEAIEHRSGALTKIATAEVLAAASSPDVAVTAAGRLDVVPNPTFDRVVSASSLPDLPKRQRILCRQIIEHVPGNTPPMFTACFKVYGRHLNQAVSEIVPGVLDDQWQTASAYLVGDEAIVLDAGLTRTLAIFAQNHAEIVAHFPLREDRERLLSETPIDEQAASGEALTAPIENVLQMVEAAAEAGQVTPALVEHVGDLADRAEALAPPPAPAANEASTTVSPRRRLVLTSLGFFERLYAAIGSTASVLSTETGRALYNAAREAADALMRFIR